MPWSGGNFTRANGNNGWVADATNGIGIEAGRHDDQDNDFKNGINQCLNKDGSNAATGNLNFGNYRPTNINAGTAAAPAICAGNDVNTGVFGPASDTWAVATNGAERLRIDSTGNVGIGTTTPTSLLDVQAAAEVSTAFTRYTDNASPFRMNFIKSRGSSLGTNTIVQNGDSLGQIQFLGANGTGYTAAAEIRVEVDGTPGASSDMPGRIRFATTADGAGSAAERMRIDNAGRVGIANISPKDTLHISTASTISPQDGAGAVGTTFGFNYYYSSGAKAISTGSRTVSMELGNNGGILKSTTATQTADAAVSGLNPYIQWGGFGDLISLSTANAERVRITSGGRIGIGTNSPQSYVSAINSESAFLNTVNCQSNVSGDATTHAMMVTKYDSSNATTQRFIGFTINQGATNSGQINANGPGLAAFGSFSDVRLKENITDLPSQLANMMALRPVEFDYKDGSGHQVGFIAQEVEAIYPDLIGDDGNGFLTLSGLGKNEARMIKAFQEFAGLIEGKIANLEARVAELEGA